MAPPTGCRFVIHTPRDPLSAVYREVERRAELVRSLGHEVEIWTPADFPRLAKIRPRWLPFLFASRVAARLLARPPRLAVLHSHSAWAFALLRRLRRRARAGRLVIQFHGLEPLHHEAVAAEHAARGEPFRRRFRLVAERVMPRLLRAACRRADRVWVLNRAEAAYVSDNGWAPPERVEIVANAVDDEAFYALPAAGGVPGRLLFLGQWLAGKGTRQLAAAFAEVATGDPVSTLAVVGTRVGVSDVLRDFPETIRSRVRVVPAVGRSELLAELRSAEIFVFPSLAEGSSLALLEAMAAGRPIVATSVGAAPDLLRDGREALLVPPDDPAALVAAIARLRREPELRERLGVAAREVAERFRWRRLRATEADRFERLLASGGSG